jgi:hypothetical protein
MAKSQKSTEQLNLRMPSELIGDLEIISKILKVNKSEWIKIKLGELVHEQKSVLLERYAELKEKGVIDKKDIERLMK